ncbi:MAG: DEAD/DEAH box helicase family protein [Kiritimatiellae bacterium]|nr:DEAD/DEAH box helicase family protein [Kiritimatiellia bacterium]
MTNFDTISPAPSFAPFSALAASAEKCRRSTPAVCVELCRRALEGAIKWMFSVDSGLGEPYRDALSSLMGEDAFRMLVGQELLRRLDFIRRVAAAAERNPGRTTPDQAALSVENLFEFFLFLDRAYGETPQERTFDPDIPASKDTAEPPSVLPDVPSLTELVAANAAIRGEFSARRAARRPSYAPRPGDLPEFRTRRLYIDTMLEDAGWVRGCDWIDEYPLDGLPTPSGTGSADYALLDASGKVLAVVEAKRTCTDVAAGRHQAALYADAIARKQGVRPVVFLSNGFETRISDGIYAERRVAAIHSRRDLEKWFNLVRLRSDLRGVSVDRDIAGRYYQEAAVKAVCEAFGAQNRRKALLVMATGSGKTRTVIALCKALLERGWVRNVLFLADRNSLVTQAKRAFVNLLSELSATNLCEDGADPSAHAVFSTYQTMMNAIDDARDKDGKLFSCGHFDLVVCDEAHRSIYNKFRDIFAWFDAPLVGLTATPKDEIDKNTYAEFDLEDGVPTYAYELAQAVRDGFLVDFVSVETTLKFLRDGIVYDELPEDEKRIYEETFRDDSGDLPPSLAASALNEWIFNEDTIRQVLRILMENGLKVDYGTRLGKTIVFAKNHAHAEKILEVFGREFPALVGHATVIDNYTSHAQNAIDEFSKGDGLPRIAISVDMLDTGIDIPEVLNLVFFKKVLSKAKFWQMIGRGTRLCPGLLDGGDKKEFYIFDFCGNFEFFRMANGQPAAAALPVQGALFRLKVRMAWELQDLRFQTPELSAFRQSLVDDLLAQTRALDRGRFNVRLHLACIEKFSAPAAWAALSYADTLDLGREIAPLVDPLPDDPKALRFDALLHGLELALLLGENDVRAKRDLLKKADALASVASIPAVAAKKELLERILNTDWLDRANVAAFEQIRTELRDLLKFVPVDRVVYDTDFADELVSMVCEKPDLGDDSLRSYREKAEYYVRRHQDDPAIAKLKGNIPLTPADVQSLEAILWGELGSRDDYEAEFGRQPLGEFVRSIVGLDMTAAKAAFAEFLDGNRLDARQIYFVNQIVEYIVRNGLMKDLSVLRKPPFTDRGSVADLFPDPALWQRLRAAIARVNANASVA